MTDNFHLICVLNFLNQIECELCILPAHLQDHSTIPWKLWFLWMHSNKLHMPRTCDPEIWILTKETVSPPWLRHCLYRLIPSGKHLTTVHTCRIAGLFTILFPLWYLHYMFPRPHYIHMSASICNARKRRERVWYDASMWHVQCVGVHPPGHGPLYLYKYVHWRWIPLA
jgi:hypothetical protein